MSTQSNYCPRCGASVAAPLLPLDYWRCKRCYAVIPEHELVKKGNMIVGVGGRGAKGEITVRGGGLSTTHATINNTISSTITGLNVGDVVVFIVASHGASGIPTVVSGPVNAYTLVDEYHSNNQQQIVMYRGTVTQGGTQTSSATWATNSIPATAYTVVITGALETPDATGHDNHNSVTATVTSGITSYAGNKVAIGAAMCDADFANLTSIDSPFETLVLAAVNDQQSPPNADLAVGYYKNNLQQAISFTANITANNNVKNATVIGVFTEQ